MSTPYSFSCKKYPKDAEDLLEAALGAAHAIKQIHGTPFTVSLPAAPRITAYSSPWQTGSLCEQLYKCALPDPHLEWACELNVPLCCRASGNVVDYMYAKAGIKFSYSVHLRDTGTVRSSVSSCAKYKAHTSLSTVSPSPRSGSGRWERKRRA